MKIFIITPGEELESVYNGGGDYGNASWFIEVRTNEETWEDEIEYNAFLKIANAVAFCHFTDDDHDKFHELQEAVDAIWRESSDIKDFAKRLYDARISDRFFEEVEFNAEEIE